MDLRRGWPWEGGWRVERLERGSADLGVESDGRIQTFRFRFPREPTV